MNRGRRRRHVRGGRRRPRIGVIAIVIFLSVGAGFLTSNYLINPALGNEPVSLDIFHKNKADEPVHDTEQTELQKNIKKNVTDNNVKEKRESTGTEPVKAEVQGYTIQYGCFSTKAAAKTRLGELSSMGIKASVKEKEGVFKLVGSLFNTKAEARKALKKIDDSIGAFIITI